MKDPTRFESHLDRTEVVTNGFKVLRLLTQEKENALKVASDYNLCLKHILDVLEEFLHHH